jgi:predicted O-methyltransferase YrrM
MYDACYADQTPAICYEYVQSVHNSHSINEVKLNAYAFMQQLEGWCSDRKAGILMDLILMSKPDVVVEIGVYGGKSVIPMACALRANARGKIYGIDPWDNHASLEDVSDPSNRAYWGTIDLSGIMQGLIEKIDLFDLQDHIELIQNTSAGVVPISEIGLLHVDGNHSDSTSYFDVTKWVPFVKKGGLIVFDDMTWYENGTYTTGRAVEWLNKNCTKIAEYSDNCVWGIWVKP